MKKVQILIVEDEALIAADLELRLQDMGYEVAGIVDTGEEALRIIESSVPDLVFMDIRLKGAMDGIEAAGSISSGHMVPVVFLTSHADSETLARASQAGPLGYLVKPFEDRELRATIETVLIRHRSEQRHRRMERWLATTLESIGDAVITTGVDGRVSYLNRVAETLTGWSVAEAMGLMSSEVLRLRAGGALGNVVDVVSEVLQCRRITCCPMDCYLLQKGGTTIPVDDSAAPIWDDQDELSGVVVVFRDRTQSLEFERERSRVEAKLLDAQKLESLGVLAGGIAHDFNNLLTGVLGNASLIKLELPRDARVFEYVQEIENAALKAADLCKQMLAYAGKGRFIVRLVDLSELVRESHPLIHMSISKRVTMSGHLSDGLPPVRADATQLRQILMNLVINASEAMGDKGGVVTLSTGVVRADRAYLDEITPSPELVEGDYVFLEVADTGCGMDKTTISRIFDPFFTTKFMGRGLGLAAVSGIVRGHKGTMKVYSEPGRGSTFKLLLPCAVGPTEQFSTEGAGPVFKGKGQVLVVDDEATVRITTARMLESMGFVVISAVNGSDCLAQFSGCNGAVEMVVLDLTMPGMDGVETFRELKRLKSDVRVLLTSGFNKQEAVSRFTGKGLAGFLQKPFNRVQLAVKLTEVFGS